MAGYADLDAVYADLSLSVNEATDSDAVAKVTVLNDALSLRFNAITHRAWGDYVAEERTIEAPDYGVSNLLVLSVAATSKPTVETDGIWNGTTWDDGITVDPTYLRLVMGGHGLERTDGVYWAGPIRLTGGWADEIDTDPPADVVAALTEAVVMEYRRQTYNARDTQRSFDEIEAAPPPRYENGPLWKAAVATQTRRALVIA